MSAAFAKVGASKAVTIATPVTAERIPEFIRYLHFMFAMARLSCTPGHESSDLTALIHRASNDA
jgi:hypothetical protein